MQVGFLYLANHGIEGAVIQNVFGAMHTFFSLDAEAKSSVAAHKSPIYRGYNSLEVRYVEYVSHGTVCPMGPFSFPSYDNY